MRRPRVVLDTGVVLSGLLRPEGPAGGLLRLLVERRAFEMVVNRGIMEELRAALSDIEVERHLQSSPEGAERLAAALGLLATHAEESELTVGECPFTVEADPEDDKYLAAARAAGAELIVSLDPHLLALQEAEEVQVVTPRVFLEFLELRSEAEVEALP